jgi:hypothetical protein
MSSTSILQHQLKTLVSGRMGYLTRKLAHSPKNSHSSPRHIVSDGLAKLIQKEVLSSLAVIFGAEPKKNDPNRPPDRDGGIVPRPTPRSPEMGGFFDYKQMEITIDQMVAESLMHGRQTSGVLRALFGIIPSLIGR